MYINAYYACINNNKLVIVDIPHFTKIQKFIIAIENSGAKKRRFPDFSKSVFIAIIH